MKVKVVVSMLALLVLLSCQLPVNVVPLAVNPYAGKTMVTDSNGILLGYILQEATHEDCVFQTVAGYVTYLNREYSTIGDTPVFAQAGATSTLVFTMGPTVTKGYMVLLRKGTTAWVMSDVDAQGYGIVDHTIMYWDCAMDGYGVTYLNQRNYLIQGPTYRLVQVPMWVVGLPSVIGLPLVYTVSP